jgi:hypothetical protein
MTKEEVIAAVQECATKLGHAPSMGGVSQGDHDWERAYTKAFWHVWAIAGDERTGSARVRAHGGDESSFCRLGRDRAAAQEVSHAGGL